MQYLSQLKYDPALADQVAESVYNILKSQYNVMISSDEFKDLVHRQTSTIYKDLSPKTDFGLSDLRAMEYLDRSDIVYLGKYITDPGLRQRIISYIKEAYLENGNAIGNSPKELRAFINVFREELDLSKGQVRRIIDTTVSHARVFGQLNGFRSSGAKTFMIIGPDDALTCSFCKEMLGREFEVHFELQQLDQLITNGPENADYIKPFLKGSLALEALADMADADIQAQGFATPPYHPHCRHRLGATSFYENLDEIPWPID